MEDMKKEKKYCPNCGEENDIAATYCSVCKCKFEDNKECKILNNEISIQNSMANMFESEKILLRNNYIEYFHYKLNKEISYECIFFKDISSIDLSFKSNRWFIIIAIILLGLSFNNNNIEPFILIIIAIALIITFFQTRRYTLGIYPNGGKPIKMIIGTGAHTKNFVQEIIKRKSNIIQNNEK